MNTAVIEHQQVTSSTIPDHMGLIERLRETGERVMTSAKYTLSNFRFPLINSPLMSDREFFWPLYLATHEVQIREALKGGYGSSGSKPFMGLDISAIGPNSEEYARRLEGFETRAMEIYDEVSSNPSWRSRDIHDKVDYVHMRLEREYSTPIIH